MGYLNLPYFRATFLSYLQVKVEALENGFVKPVEYPTWI